MLSPYNVRLQLVPLIESLGTAAVMEFPDECKAFFCDKPDVTVEKIKETPCIKSNPYNSTNVLHSSVSSSCPSDGAVSGERVPAPNLATRKSYGSREKERKY